jgi:outer membrane biosynthesis protein TonB
MHLAYRLAIVLCLSVTATGWQAEHQDPAGSANATGQAPAPPAPPVENAPPEKSPAQKEKPQPEHAPVEQAPAEKSPSPANPQTPAPGKTAPESAAKETTDASSANGTRKRRKRATSAPGGTARKIVVREGGASEPAAQIAPGLTPAEATRQRHNAEQLLGATDDKLKRLAGRTLDAKQQETMGQIRNYMEGARSALKEGDVRRANTLAQKAHLLSEDLVRH